LSRAEGILLVGLSFRKKVQRRNFERTMRSSWSFDRIVRELELSGELINKLRPLVEGVSEFRIWGCPEKELKKSKKKSENENKKNEESEKKKEKKEENKCLKWWNNAEKYVAVFLDFNAGSVVCWGRIFAKILSEKLSEALWGTNKWRYVYFLRDVVWINGAVLIAKLVKELGCKENYKPRGHQTVASEKVQEIVRRFESIENFLRSLAQAELVQHVVRPVTVSKSAVAEALKLLSSSFGDNAAHVFMRVVGRVVSSSEDFGFAVDKAVENVLSNTSSSVKGAVRNALTELRRYIDSARTVLFRCGEDVASVTQDADLALGALAVLCSADALGSDVAREVVNAAKSIVRENLYVVMLCRLCSFRISEW
jgi:hypothetical protein